MDLNTKVHKKGYKEKYPGVPLLHFRFLFKKVEEVVRALGFPALTSPYSIIPLISQAIGSDVPMMGSGKSPYSIISYFSRLDKNIFLESNAELTYQERREIIDEVYDMLAPYLLQEQANYIELLVATRYKKALQNLSEEEISKFKEILNKKFKILHQFLSKIQFTGGDYAHIAHYGYPEDLYREQNFLKDFDAKTSRLWRENSYPIVAEMQIDGFNALNRCIRGWYIFIPNYTEELLRNKALRQKKLLQAGILARRLNAKFAGMAGLIASFSKGGKFLADNIKDFGFTTGHAFTIANIYEIVKAIIKTISLDLSKSRIAVIGAAGSIGSGVAKLISENQIKEIILIDIPNIVSSAKLIRLKNILKQINTNNPVQISKTINDTKDADLLIIATNSLTSIIHSEHLKPGAVIIDDSFPKNVSRDILNERDDIVLLEGGASQLPKTLNVDVARNIPDLLDLSVSKLISCRQAYGCLCETFILAALGHRGNYGLGDADPQLAKEIMSKGRKLGFVNAVFQNYGFAVEESRIKKVKDIIRNR